MPNPYEKLYEPIPDTKPYLEKIGCEAPKEFSLEELTNLMECHMRHIPYENMDVFLYHKTPNLEPVALYNKMILNHRGGYCFELNGIFCSFLQALGFKAYPVSIRIMRNKDFTPPPLHRGTVVEIDGKQYYCDVGCGPATPTVPVELNEELGWQFDGSGYYRIRIKERTNDRLTCLNYKDKEGEEKCMFTFVNEAAEPSDFLGPNYVCAGPTGAFRRCQSLNIHTEKGIASLQGNTLNLSEKGVIVETRELTDEEAKTAIREIFGVILPE